MSAHTAAPAADRKSLTLAQRRQIAWITVAALAVFALFRWLPTGSNLSHMDFRVEAANAIDFCDPSNPQFIPVVAVASPIAMEVLTTERTPARPGEVVRAVARLRTASGKPIAPEDLLVVHTERLHLLIADPSLNDYQHVHPQPGRAAGEWEFEFTPQTSGAYRVFADFTPTATSRGLYASADLEVAPGAASAPAAMVESREESPYRFTLTPATGSLYARVPMDLRFEAARADGGPVPLEPVMDAYAHLVAFDEARSGFAHLHPMEADLAQKPDATKPTLNFKITIPTPGRYVIWAQVKIAGQERFVPFWFNVLER